LEANRLKSKKNIALRLIIIAVLSVLSARYFNELLVGDNSVGVYYDLKERQETLKDEIVRLQNENARLQKEYFELKSLEPDILEDNK
jgi:cell division protein FtsB